MIPQRLSAAARMVLAVAAATVVASTFPSFSADEFPEELKNTRFSGPDVTPCPACLCAAPTGEVFVGVDVNGSLGKLPDKGRIVRLIDTDQDGAADRHTVYATIDNPRGLISIGKKLYVLHTVFSEETKKLEAMHLSVLEDADWDGIADGAPRRLISNISVAKHNQDRGADHTTNGIQIGIDGWIYVAVGDFGFIDATGADGTTLTMLGGGVVRVRPDGTEFEVYTHGLRNIYDVAIDPLLNIYTRGNTNDGGGWNIRFAHHIQTGEYGYPVLFKNFTGEIIPALVDVGGGSGTGALFLSEPGWPDKYTNVPMMCDWGRSQLVIHRLTPDGPSFTQEPEEFIRLSQITDLDVDGSGRLYLGAWDGAGYTGNLDKGYVERVVPKDWRYTPFPSLSELSGSILVDLLKSPSAVTRLHAQHEILSRGGDAIAAQALGIAGDGAVPVEARVAAIFTYKQLLGQGANKAIAELASDAGVREFALRAMTDRKSQLEDAPLGLFLEALTDRNPRVQVAAAVGLGRLENLAAAQSLLAVSNPPEDADEAEPEEPAAPPAFESDSVRRRRPIDIDVDIAGFKQLFLAVDDDGGPDHDHAAWIEPTLVKADGSTVNLTDLKWKSATQGWGKTAVNQTCDGSDLASSFRQPIKFGIGTHAPSSIVYDLPEGAVRFAAKAGLTRGAGRDGKVRFLVSASPVKPSKPKEDLHATPHPGIIVPHVAVRSLVALGAAIPCVDAIGGPYSDGALWALRHMHRPAAIDGLIAKYSATADPDLQREILAALMRLYQKEAPYDGSWWWGTRPDTRGPYYKPATWEESDKIAAFLRAESENLDPAGQTFFAASLKKHRIEIDGLELAAATVPESKAPKAEEPTIDLAKIAQGGGEIGRMSIEDIILALGGTKGSAEAGEKLFSQQACFACHTTSESQPLKGPFMGHVGSILSRDQIAESILKPNASISQGFATVSIATKNGGAHTGFISKETADDIEIRDIAGNVTTVKTAEIASRTELEISMMPPGLANALSVEQFASLVSYLQSLKK